MKLKSFDIVGLFGHWRLKSNLDPKVNILTGDNGSFKTNLIRLIRDFLSQTLKDTNIERCVLNFIDGDDNISLYYRHFKDSLLSLKKTQNDELLQALAAQVESDLKDANDKTLSERILNADITAYKKNGGNIKPKDFKNAAHVDFVSTFDIPQKSKNDKDSFLDETLSDLEKDYAYYMSDLAQQLKDVLSRNVQDRSDNIRNIYDSIYSTNNKFLSIINDSFKSTGKEIDTKRSELHFLVDGDRLTTRQLSSGEKQLLIIMLTVLLERGQEFILLMDEPEISLHLDWQSHLIDNILSLNPNCQIVMTSHSPGILLRGWEQYTIQMSSITEKL